MINCFVGVARLSHGSARNESCTVRYHSEEGAAERDRLLHQHVSAPLLSELLDLYECEAVGSARI